MDVAKFLMSITLFFHFLAPLVHWLIRFIRAKCAESEHTKKYASMSEAAETDTLEKLNKEETTKIDLDFEKETPKITPTADEILKSLPTLYSIYFHIDMVIMIIYLIVANTTVSGFNDIVFSLNLVCYISMPISVGVIFLEARISRELKYLRRMKDEHSILVLVKNLIQARPVVAMKVTCWHETTKAKVVSDSNSVGIETTVTRFIDHTDLKVFYFARCQDVSIDPDTITLDKGKLTRVRLHKHIKFGDKRTADEYNRQMNEMMSSAKENYPNSKVSFERTDSIENFVSTIASYWDTPVVKYWMTERYYILASVFGCTWFYRIAFNKATPKLNFTIEKEIFLE